MKKFSIILFALFCATAGISQEKANLVVFSEDGDAFFAYVNGIRQNDKAETNVRVTGLSPNVSLRIVFDDKTMPELKQTMFLESGFEHTARIKKDLKKQVKLQYFGQTPIGEQVTDDVTTVHYHTSENPIQNETAVQQGTDSYNQQTTTTTRVSQGDNVNVNMGMAGVGISMQVTSPDVQHQTTTVSSTTVTRSSTGYQNNQTQSVQESGSTTVASGGCKGPMTPSSFATMKKSVESKPFSDTKMSTAKVATKNACLSVGQVKEICKLFSMDDDKLSYAKYAYDYCVEKSNYYTVGDVFSFSSSTEELNKFLETK